MQAHAQLSGGMQGNMMGQGMGQQMVPPGGGMQASLPPPPMPPPAPVYVVQEVQVPAALMTDVVGSGGSYLDAIKKKAGGDVQIELAGGGNGPGDLRTFKVRGPQVSASLGSCLLLQRAAEVM